MLKIRLLLSCLLLLIRVSGLYAQERLLLDTVPDLKLDWVFRPVFMQTMLREPQLERTPDRKDQRTVRRLDKLQINPPDSRNYRQYLQLAQAYLETGQFLEAKPLFLNILQSDSAFYNQIYYSSTTLDTSQFLGYGGSTYHFKHQACIGLTKIFLEEKNPEAALYYLKLAEHQYGITHGCGTAVRYYTQELNDLYSLCYEGLNHHTEVIDRYLPICMEEPYGVLVRTLRKQYTPEEIQAYLLIAEKSITIGDTIQVLMEDTVSGSQESVYTTATATLMLFDREVTIPAPYLEAGELISREYFVKHFRQSTLYRALTGEE